MSNSLKIAAGLTLPLDAVTQSIAILAKRRAGKSYTARRIAEQFFKASAQLIIVDPKGDWWGIRSSADGKSPGLPIIILGGERGDAPLEVHSGELVAKLAVEEQVSILLDLSLFRKHEVCTFMTAFLETLYRLKAREQFRTPAMLIIDEADAIAPQKPMKGEERMLGASEDIVRRGGQRGIGCLMITQRSAVLNKNVLTQVQVLVALRTIAPQDLDALSAWIDVHGTPAQRKILMESLPALPTGDAWFWSPGWPTVEGIFERVHVLPIETFDSGATPKPGEKRIQPKNLADVDMEAIRKQMAATIEKAKADDPKELRKRIAELERDAKKQPVPVVAAPPKLERVEVPILKDSHMASLEKVAGQVAAIAEKSAGQFTAATEKFAGVAGEIVAELKRLRNGHHPPPSLDRPSVSSRVGIQRQIVKRDRPASGAGEMKGMHRTMLIALAQHPEGLTKGQILLHTGYASSGPVSTAFADLARNEWAAMDGGRVRITGLGLSALGEYDPLPTGDALRDFLLAGNKLSTMEKALLSHICAAYPESITKGQVLERANYASSGPVSTAFARLVRYGYAVASGSSRLRASEVLFE